MLLRLIGHFGLAFASAFTTLSLDLAIGTLLLLVLLKRSNICAATRLTSCLV
jgi:hypothetical protein